MALADAARAQPRYGALLSDGSWIVGADLLGDPWEATAKIDNRRLFDPANPARVVCEELRSCRPAEEFLALLGAAATPGALFAIGASLATKSAERLSVAFTISAFKLFIHPAAVALTALVIWPVDPFAAKVMVAAAALPVAGNVYILAQHYNVAPQRVSAAILVSTAISVVTVSAAIAWLETL